MRRQSTRYSSGIRPEPPLQNRKQQKLVHRYPTVGNDPQMRELQYPLPRLIRGWQEGVPMMRVGETWEFVIPAKIAYGERYRDPIPANSTLLFEIELIDVPSQ